MSNAPDYQLVLKSLKSSPKHAEIKRWANYFRKSVYSVNGPKIDLVYNFHRSSDSYADVDFPGQRYGVTLNQSLVAVADGLELNRMNLLQQRN